MTIQEQLPENRSLATWISYFMTTGGAIAAMLSIGVLGDVVGLRFALIAAAAIASGPGVAS